MSANALRVAVLGTGIMGAPMARNMAAAGLAVKAWNRTTEKAQPLAGEGVEVCESVEDAVAQAQVVVTMLADGDAVAEVAEPALDGLPEGAVWAQMSTVGIDAHGRLAEMAAARDVPFVDAPVLGTKAPAEQGELIVLAAGPDGARERCAPIFDAVGAKTVDLGEAGEATRLKLVLNNWILTLVEGLAETIAFAERIGVDPGRFLDTIDGGPLGPPYAQVKGRAMVAREFPPSFTLALARKDAGLVLDAAGSAGIDLPVADAIAAQLDTAIEAGHGDEDMAAAYWASAPEDGAG